MRSGILTKIDASAGFPANGLKFINLSPSVVETRCLTLTYAILSGKRITPRHGISIAQYTNTVSYHLRMVDLKPALFPSGFNQSMYVNNAGLEVIWSFRNISAKIFQCEFPIDQFIQQCCDVVRAPILEVKVIGMLPHIDGQ